MLTANGVTWIVMGACAVAVGSYEIGKGLEGARGTIFMGLAAVVWGIINLCV
jgi:hypothetical protein